MSTYIHQRSPAFENAPPWLQEYLSYRQGTNNATKKTLMSYYIVLREFCQYWHYRHTFKMPPDPAKASALREMGIHTMGLEELPQTEDGVKEYLSFIFDLGNTYITRQKKLAYLRQFYDYLRDLYGDTFPINPSKKIRLIESSSDQRQMDYLSLSQQKKLLESISGDNQLRDYALILLLLSTGITVAEATELNLEDVKSSTLHIRGRRERLLPLTPACATAIRQYISDYRSEAMMGRDNNYALFVSKNFRRRITYRGIEGIIQKVVVAAGMDAQTITPRVLRNTAAVTLLQAGTEYTILALYLGCSPATALKYQNITKRVSDPKNQITRAVACSPIFTLGEEDGKGGQPE